MNPVVASYCTTFLKPEMLHIYRQVVGLRQFETFVLTRSWQHKDLFPMPEGDVVVLRNARVNPFRRLWEKYFKRVPALLYRGELEGMRRALAARPADLMHVYFGHIGVHLLPFIEQWDKPVVVSFHGMDVQPRENEPRYMERLRRMLQLVPLVLVRSDSLAQRVVELGCDESKIRLNRTGIPLESFPEKQREAPADGAWHVVQACRLVEKKGLDDTLHAFAEFRKVYPKAMLTLAGEGPLHGPLAKMVEQMGLAECVCFAGFIDGPSLCRLYHKAHIFIHPSRMTGDKNQEGVPNSMLEAMATGLPVVATQHGGIPEAVQHKRNGLLGPERDREALKDHLLALAGNPDLYTTCSRNASADVRKNFDQTTQIANLEAIYFEAMRLGR